jgi:multicomponent Na+:H+ antiporter subunit D
LVFGGAPVFENLVVDDALMALGMLSMIAAAVVAVFQTNIKRMLAYSSVAQIGYITFGIGLANKAGLTGGIVHLFNHAVMKGALFLELGAIVYRLGTVRLDDLSGIGRKMPLTCAALVIAGLGIIDTPGTAGFVSKWYLVVGALDRGWWPLVFLIVASSLISIIYIGRVVEVAYFRPASEACERAKDPPLNMLLPILLLGAATIYFGIETKLTVGIAGMVAEGLLGGLQ